MYTRHTTPSGEEGNMRQFMTLSVCQFFFPRLYAVFDN